MTPNNMPPVRDLGRRPESLPEALSAILSGLNLLMETAIEAEDRQKIIQAQLNALLGALAGQQRIESKLDALLEALAADDEEETEEPALDLSGRPVPGARDQGGAL